MSTELDPKKVRVEIARLLKRAAALREEAQKNEEKVVELSRLLAMSEFQGEQQRRDGVLRMRSVHIVAKDYADFSKQAEKIRVAHPGTVGLDEPQLANIWAGVLRGGGSPGKAMSFEIFYHAP